MQSGYSTAVSYNNTCVGYQSGYDQLNSPISNNTFIGSQSGTNETGNNNTMVGAQSDRFSRGSQGVTALGYASGPSANGLINATAIGAYATVGASNTMVLGATGNYAVNVGIGTSTPGSTLQVVGSVAASIRTLTSGTVADNDYTVLVGGNISLPTPSATNSGRMYNLLTTGGSYVVSASFRDASGTFGTYGLNTSAGGRGIVVQSDGTNWWIISSR